MTRALLVRGLLAGLIAGLFAVGFARLFGEGFVQQAIDFESVAAIARGEAPEPELVSRAVQRGLGLLTGGVMYAAGLGGIFSLVFAACVGRVRLAPRRLALLLAGLGFIAMVLAPQLKYPANPPSVGEAETIGTRTLLYFEMIAVSLGAMTLACLATRGLQRRIGWDNAWLAGAALFGVVVMAVQWTLPAINEVPPTFSAALLWNFRVAALGMQAILWGTLGIVFGWMAERVLYPASERRRAAILT